MQQLTGMDASFLYFETPTAPMHVGGIGIYDQSTAPKGLVRFKELLKNCEERLQQSPTLTRRLLKVPLDLDHPYWVSDGTFDPEFHIRHLALPKPGDWRQFCIMISRLNARHLDRDKPLWEIYVIEGLDNVEGFPPGCFATFIKMHHALVDGTSGTEINTKLHDLSPDYKSNKAKPVVEEDEIPGKLKLLVKAQVNNILKPLRFIDVARNTVPGFAKTYAKLRKGELQSVGRLPRTRFNDNVSNHRVFNAVSMPLNDIKAIKNSIPGVTVNDVAITICGGAIREYLLAKKELPEKSLVAMAPINVRSESEKDVVGNLVSAMQVEVFSNIANPVERLQAVHSGTKNAKELSSAIGAKTMTDYTQFIPSMLTAQAARLASERGLVNQIRPMYNCVITNVPGPQIPIYNTGAKLLASYGTAPIFDSIGLMLIIGSYCGDFTISVTSCRKMMPDPDFFADCIRKSFNDLKLATQDMKPKAPNKRTKASKKAVA